MNKVNLKNVFAITLRDTGKLALVDGDTKQIWQILDTGYAVHISRLSASGRYVYTVGRDGLVTLIDLWYESPPRWPRSSSAPTRARWTPPSSRASKTST
jgi:nitrite reductase (NO-forming)/hydroxylamine reductase